MPDPVAPSQPPPPPEAPPSADPSSLDLPPNIAAAIACIPLVGGIIFYLLEKRNSFVRFYAMQSIIFGGAWVLFNIASAVVHAVVGAIPGVGPLIAAGPIMAALAGMGVGGAIGGITGALIGMGIPEYEAKRYEGRIQKGGILLSVHCTSSDEVKRAKEVLERTGAEDVSATGESSASAASASTERTKHRGAGGVE